MQCGKGALRCRFKVSAGRPVLRCATASTSYGKYWLRSAQWEGSVGTSQGEWNQLSSSQPGPSTEAGLRKQRVNPCSATQHVKSKGWAGGSLLPSLPHIPPPWGGQLSWETLPVTCAFLEALGNWFYSKDKGNVQRVSQHWDAQALKDTIRSQNPEAERENQGTTF